MSDIVKRLRSPANVFYEYAADNGAFLREASDEITRLRAELAAALAECERLNKSRNRWGKKYNDCLGKLRLAVMSDSDECKELTAQNNNLRTDLASVKEERDRMREALKPFAKLKPANWSLEIYYISTDDITAVRAALEGVTEPAKGDSNA